MFRRKLLYLAALPVLVMALSTPLLPQDTNGYLSGVVQDQSGAAIPGAEVTVTNQGTNLSRTVVTSDIGSFRLGNLEPGLYEVRVSLTGFKTYVVRDVKINVGEEYSLTARLEIGELTDTITVLGGADLVNTADIQVSTTIEKRQIQDLPLQARNPLNLITLQAGTANNGLVPTSIAGLRPSYTNMTLDGVNIQDNFLRGNATTFTPARVTQAMVSEFSISSINQGTATGFGASQVSFVTPSGTNDINGEVYWVHRNNATKANEFFNNLADVDKPFLLRNQFGVAASGALIKDKFFWYANYEGFRERAQQSFQATVLTQTARQGIYQYEAADGSGLQEVDLLSLRGVSADPFMADQIAQTPLGNDPTGGDGLNTLGYRYNLPSNEDRDQFGFRLDYILNDAHSFEGIYRANDFTNDRPDFLSGFDETFSQTISRPEFFSTAWNWTLSPNFFNEVRFGGNLSGVVFTDERGFLQQRGFKIVAASYTDPEGNGERERQGRDTNTWNWSDNANWTRGAHSFRFGFQAQHIRNFTFAGFNVTPTYWIGANTTNGFELDSGEFPGGIGSGDRNRATDILSDLAGILDEATGEFHIRSRSNPSYVAAEEAFHWENDIYALYFGDAWRLGPRITLNAGLRWEWYQNIRERDDLITQPVITSDSKSAVLDPDNVVDWLDGDVTKNDLNNFAPQIGLAWDLFGNGKTALRMGYGLAYAADQRVVALENALNRYGVTSFVTLSELTETISNRPGITQPNFKLPLSWPEINNPASEFFVESFPAAFVVDPNLVDPYVQTWQVGLTHEIGWNTAIEVRYAGSKGTKLLRSFDWNQVTIRENGFLNDFIRAQSNGELAEAAGLGYVPAYNPEIPGSQPLPVFDQMALGGLLDFGIGAINNRIRDGEAGDLMNIYWLNGLCGAVQCNPNNEVLVGDVTANGGDSNYHSLQIEGRRRFSDGLLFSANYTFGKAIANQTTNNQANFEPILDLFNPSYDRGRTSWDLTHVFNAAFLWEMPFGRGRRFDIENSVLNQIAGGWEVTSIFNIQSGDPFSLYSNRGTMNRFGRTWGRNRASSTLGNDGIRSLIGVASDADGPYFFDAAAAEDGRLFHPGPGEGGSLPRFGFNGPSQFSWDLGLIKKFPVTEDYTVEFRGEFFNLINHTNFSTGHTAGLDRESQRDSTLDIAEGDFGRLQLTNTDARIIQFSLKFIF